MSRRATIVLSLCGLLLAGACLLLVLWPQDEHASVGTTNVPDPSHTTAGGVFSSIPIEVESPGVSPVASTEDCAPKMTPEALREYEERQQAHFADVARRLSTTVDAEYVLAAALMRQLESENVSAELFERAFRYAPTSPLVTWNMLRMCRDREIIDCDLERIEANAIRADGDNAAVWMEIAMLRLSDGRLDDASRMVRQAVAAPRFDSYFIEQALLIERALSTGGDSTYTERMIEGIGYSAASVVSYYGMTKFCRTVDAANTEWIDLCHQIGEKMFVDGQVLLDRALGVALMKIAASHTHDADKIAASIEQESEFRERYLNPVASMATQNLLANDESVLRRYVENLATLGEVEALSRLDEEVVRLRATDGYDQCNFVNPHAIQ